MSERRLGVPAATSDRSTPGVRVVLDLRPLQDPSRAPVTATYLDQLLRAFAAQPVDGESFAFFLQAGLSDPTATIDGLEVIGRRVLPPTRLLRSSALTVDPFLLRGASVGAAWRADRGGASGAVFHTASGAVPLASGLPLVVTLLDLAPWELPHAYQRSPAARFGHRLRARLLRDAAAVIVVSDASARAARRLLHIRSERLHVVPLAPRAAFDPAATGAAAMAAAPRTGGDGGQERRTGDTAIDHRQERVRLGLGERYFVYFGRYDARQDLATLLRALADLAGSGRPSLLGPDVEWPPRVLLVGASPGDRAALARAAARIGVGEQLAYAPNLDPARLASLVAGARAALLPAISEAAGLPAIEALACGTPVVASAVGALPEIVGGAGILVEPRDPTRLATALTTAWADDGVWSALADEAQERATARRRTWSDVALETRSVYAEAAQA